MNRFINHARPSVNKKCFLVGSKVIIVVKIQIILFIDLYFF